MAIFVNELDNNTQIQIYISVYTEQCIIFFGNGTMLNNNFYYQQS